MANNVYIGNRYVPVFADPVEWDNLRQYEPLTIVTYQGTAYTSKKTVPVGTALSNTEYWVVTGNYNAQVEQYRQEVVALAGDVDTLETNLGTVSNKVNGVSDKVARNNMPSNMDNVIAIGDSYALTADTNWADYMRSMFGLASNKFYKSALGSTGFGAVAQGKNFTSLLQDAYNANTAEFNSSVTHIVVCGGANDLAISGATVLAGIQSFLALKATLYPNARVYIGFIGNTKSATNKQYISEMMYYYKNSQGVYTYLDGVEYIMHRYDFFQSDGVHPNPTASATIGRYIARCILDGSVSVVYMRKSVSTVHDRNIYEMLDNGMVTISSNGIMEFDVNDLTLTNGQRYELGTLGDGYAWGSYFEDAVTDVAFWFLGQNSTWVTGQGTVGLYENKLYLYPIVISGSSGPASYTHISKLRINKFEIHVPTLFS